MQASPQVEDGYTRIADEFLEALICADYPASVLRFMLVVVRETWGWQRKEAKIPTKRFVEAFGVTERRVRQIRDDCLRHNLIEVESGEQFDTPIYRVQKRYMDWLTWKTNNPWEGPPTRKTNIPSFPEDEHTDSSEDRYTEHIKESLKEKRENDRAREENEDGERPRPSGDADLEGIPELKQAYPATAQWLWANVRHWKPKIQHRWLRAIATAIESPSDTWLQDDLQAAELLKSHPPKAADELIPGKWLERMEAQNPTLPPRGKPSDELTRQRMKELEDSGWFESQEAQV